MKKFTMVAAAVLGLAWLGMGASAQAGGHHHGHYGHHGNYGNHGHYGHRHHHHHHSRSYSNWGYRRPIYGVPVYGGYPMAPAYPYYYGGTSFGISTPNFGLFVR